MWLQLFFYLIEKPPFAAPSGALKAQILELGLIPGANLERRGAAARRGRRGGADRFEISGQKTAFCLAASSLQIWGAVPCVGTNSQRRGAGACRGLHGGPRGGA